MSDYDPAVMSSQAPSPCQVFPPSRLGWVNPLQSQVIEAIGCPRPIYHNFIGWNSADRRYGQAKDRQILGTRALALIQRSHDRLEVVCKFAFVAPRTSAPTLGLSRSPHRPPLARSFVNRPQRASLMLRAFTTQAEILHGEGPLALDR
jgi:hypothetical protein